MHLRMLALIIIGLNSYSERLKAQDCYCERDTFLNQWIGCDTLNLKSDSKVIYQFNCDSSWLIFKNGSGVETVLFSLGSGLLDLTQKLTWYVEHDYNNQVLFVARETSGLPTTLCYRLFDKNKALVIKELRQVIYCRTSSTCDFLLYVNESDKDRLTLCMLPSLHEHHIPLPQSMSETQTAIYIERQFAEPRVNGQLYTFDYYFFDKKTRSEKVSSVSIDMTKYCP